MTPKMKETKDSLGSVPESAKSKSMPFIWHTISNLQLHNLHNYSAHTVISN